MGPSEFGGGGKGVRVIVFRSVQINGPPDWWVAAVNRHVVSEVWASINKSPHCSILGVLQEHPNSPATVTWC